MSQCTIDPCDRPSYCEDGDMTGDVDDCFSFLSCLHGAWISSTCGTLAFDMNICNCNHADQALCATCSSNGTEATVLPGELISKTKKSVKIIQFETVRKAVLHTFHFLVMK